MFTSGRIINTNREAKFNYFIDDTIEAGIVLRGNEIRAIRDTGMTIKGSWVDIENGELILKGTHITPCRYSNKFDVDENRDRKLLAHSKEIRKLASLIKTEGYTLVPLKVYINNKGKCKVLVGVCRGKKLYDKRASLKAASMDREASRASKLV